MDRNPYAPPTASVSDFPASGESDLRLATRGRRLANSLLDTVGYYLLAIVMSIVMALVSPTLLDRLAGPGSYVFAGTIWLLYYVPMETIFGRTLGKLITGTRVVTEAGKPPGSAQILGRTLIRMIPLEFLTFLDDKPVGWHDRWSGTRVIQVRGD